MTIIPQIRSVLRLTLLTVILLTQQIRLNVSFVVTRFKLRMVSVMLVTPNALTTVIDVLKGSAFGVVVVIA